MANWAAFEASGRVTEIADSATRAMVAAAYHALVQPHDTLFAFDIERCLHAKYRHRGD